MKKFFLTLTVAAVFVAVAALADSIVRPPTVEWDPVTKYSDGRNLETNAVVKYNVYRSTAASTNLVKIATTTNTFYVDTNAVLATTYTYRIAGELWGLEATLSPGMVFMTYAPAQITTAPRLQQ